MTGARRLAGIALIAAAIACLVIVGMMIAPSFIHPDASRFESTPGASADGIFPEIDWEALGAENPDVVGWVAVPGTNIDYPIVQAPADEPEMYLETNLEGNRGRGGCPYLDATCAEQGLLSPLSLIFGHSLIDGSMFSDFQYMSEEGYASSHSRILLMTPESNRLLEIAAVRVVDADIEQKVTGFASTDEAYGHLLAEVGSSAVVGKVPTSPCRVWCFVTCSYQTGNSRTLVYATEAELR